MNQVNQFTAEHLRAYEQDGFTIVRNMFSEEEVGLMLEAYDHDVTLQDAAFDLNDKSSFKTKLSLWYNWGDDVYGAHMRSERLLSGVKAVLGEEIALYHIKFMQKEPRVGGAWEWHQDYGYWYKNGFLFPDMMSVMIAVSEANKANGCLQVIRGTHKLGRIEHAFSGEQVGADEDRVNTCLERGMELVYVELQPGDALFFHCNLLHRSAANLSDRPRFSIIGAYNQCQNKPYKDGEPSSTHEPVTALPDDYILANGARGLKENAGFLSPEEDKALQDREDYQN